jgi:hypothetical protein
MAGIRRLLTLVGWAGRHSRNVKQSWQSMAGRAWTAGRRGCEGATQASDDDEGRAGTARKSGRAGAAVGRGMISAGDGGCESKDTVGARRLLVAEMFEHS